MKFRLFALALAFCLVSSSAVMACHSNYFDEIFAKIQKQKLDKHQIAAIFTLKSHFNKQKSLDHQKGHSCSKHDSHVPNFVAAAAGVLTDDQFKNVTGKEKTETQKLRYDINQLKREIAEIKALLKDIKSSK